ncbi:hypothetical protein HN873_039137 [Arachis hypogaea]
MAEFLLGIRVTCEPLYKRLRKNPPPWTEEITSIIIKIKNAIKEIPCIIILDPLVKLIVETDASELGYGGILKQIPPNSSKEQIEDLFNKIFIIRSDCKAVLSVLKNDVKNLVSKQILQDGKLFYHIFIVLLNI